MDDLITKEFIFPTPQKLEKSCVDILEQNVDCDKYKIYPSHLKRFKDLGFDHETIGATALLTIQNLLRPNWYVIGDSHHALGRLARRRAAAAQLRGLRTERPVRVVSMAHRSTRRRWSRVVCAWQPSHGNGAPLSRVRARPHTSPLKLAGTARKRIFVASPPDSGVVARLQTFARPSMPGRLATCRHLESQQLPHGWAPGARAVGCRKNLRQWSYYYDTNFRPLGPEDRLSPKISSFLAQIRNRLAGSPVS